MRFVAAAALSIAMAPWSVPFAAEPASAHTATITAAAPPSSAAADAAAARHAKRTTCRKQASDKKLVAGTKYDYIKQCMAKP